MNIARHLERSAAFFPDHPAVRAEDREISYRELNGQASRIAAALSQLGLRPGDFVGL
jgi:acyl-CoA synthetase (AMP-forming)/AMP-acid ligase II